MLLGRVVLGSVVLLSPELTLAARVAAVWLTPIRLRLVLRSKPRDPGVPGAERFQCSRPTFQKVEDSGSRR